MAFFHGCFLGVPGLLLFHLETLLLLTGTLTNLKFFYSRTYDESENNKTRETTFDDTDQWRFTPSMLDTNSFTFTQFANEGAHDCAVASPNLSGIFHNQAGDLHTPGMVFQVGTSFSNDNSHSGSALDAHSLHPNLLHTHPFNTTNDLEPQRTYAPSSFLHQDSGYQAVHNIIHEAPDSKQALSRGGHDILGLDQYPGNQFVNAVTTQSSLQDKY